jgi:uncharacterized protein (DUF4415 family)
MRTSFEIDDQLMREAMRCSGARTKKAAMEAALQLLVRTYAQGAIARLRGKVIWGGPGDRTTSRSRSKGKTDFKRLRQMRDADIDDSDIPKLDRSFWKHAKLTMPEPKDRLTIRVDHDVVEWLKRAGSGYQTRINAILRSYMKAQSEWGVGRRPLFAAGRKPRPLAKGARRAGRSGW